MTKKQIYKVFIFLVITILLDQFMGRVMNYCAQKHKYDKRIELLINNKINSEIIIIGSSRALNGYSPSIISKVTKKNCYNLGTSGSNILFHEAMIDIVIQTNNKPKKILYNIDDAGALIDLGDKIIFRKDMLYPYVNHPIINKIISKELGKELWATKFSNTYLNNVNFISTIKYLTRGQEKMDYETNNVNKLGANLMEGHKKGFNQKSLKKQRNAFFDKIKDEHTPYLQSLKRIIAKCKKNNIELVLVLPPLHHSPTIGFKERIEEIIPDHTKLLDFSEALKHPSCFYNYDHLNKKGAQKFSNLLGKEL